MIKELSIEEIYQYFRDHKEEVDWEYISLHQKLSESFIREFKDRLDFVAIIVRSDIPRGIIDEITSINNLTNNSLSKGNTITVDINKTPKFIRFKE